MFKIKPINKTKNSKMHLHNTILSNITISSNYLDITTETKFAFSNMNTNTLKKIRFLDSYFQTQHPELNFLHNHEDLIPFKRKLDFLKNKKFRIRRLSNGSIRFQRRPTELIFQGIEQVKSLMNQTELDLFCSWLRELYSEFQTEKENIYSICFIRKLQGDDETEFILFHVTINKQDLQIQEIKYEKITLSINFSNFLDIVIQNIKNCKSQITSITKIQSIFGYHNISRLRDLNINNIVIYSKISIISHSFLLLSLIIIFIIYYIWILYNSK
jgi:hypothetical protein